MPPVLAPSLPAGVPEVVAVLGPGCGYPEHWSVVRWIDGEHPAVVTPKTPADPRRADLAAGLAEVVDARPAPRWYHGDLTAENLLVRDGRLAAAKDQEHCRRPQRPGRRRLSQVTPALPDRQNSDFSPQ